MAKKVTDVEVIERDGLDTIELPKGMSMTQGIEWLQKKLHEAEQPVRVAETIKAGHYLDGLWAFTQALRQKYGGQAQFETQIQETFFGRMENPPTLVSLEIGYRQTAQVPVGQLVLPNVTGKLQLGIERRDGKFYFQLQGVIKQKDKGKVKDLCDLAREFARERSLYKAKAVKLPPPAEEDEDPMAIFMANPSDGAPKFMDTAVNPEELIFPAAVQEMVDIHLKTPVEKTEACRQQKIPLKRGILLEGPYGVGKTFLARVMSKIATDNGWTFIYLDDVTNLSEAIAFAREYQPAIIFAEDVDRAVAARDEAANEILNTIDGIESKGSEVMVVLSTNHAEKITQAMLRPGRLDAIISIKAPDQGAAARLIRNYGRGLLDHVPDALLLSFAKRLEGQIPAVLREVVERAKLAAVRRQKAGEKLAINMLDLHAAADSIDTHLALLNRPVVRDESTVEWFARMMRARTEKAVNDALIRDRGEGRQIDPLPLKQIELPLNGS